jgi:protein phosphatase
VTNGSGEDDDTTLVTARTRALRADEAPEITLGDENELGQLEMEAILEGDAPVGSVAIEACGLSEGGRRRKNNEDAFLLLKRVQLYAVADGIGERAGGEVASDLALEVLRRALLHGPIEGTSDVMRPQRADELVRAFEMANRAVHRRAQRDADYQGMGTTLTALCVSATRAYVAHVGDSRCYRLRDGGLTQLTHDHTRAEELGGVGPLAAALTRAVGIEPTVEIELLVFEAAPGDLFLLCTDGLSSALGNDQIAAIASGPGDLPTRARALVDRADEESGKDNITVVLVAIESAQS